MTPYAVAGPALLLVNSKSTGAVDPTTFIPTARSAHEVLSQPGLAGRPE